MKFLIPEDEFGVFADQRGVPRVDSLFVAATFEKQHYNVLRDIGRITASNSGLSPEFIALNFEGNTYRDARGRKLPRYLLTRDGFTMLVMGYTGSKAMHFKELYIQRFNEMEQCIRSLLSARQEFPMLTDMICRLHESPKAYHFSNEADMLNRIVLGMVCQAVPAGQRIEKAEHPALSDCTADPCSGPAAAPGLRPAVFLPGFPAAQADAHDLLQDGTGRMKHVLRKEPLKDGVDVTVEINDENVSAVARSVAGKYLSI